MASAAAAVRRTPAGTAVLVGYLAPEPGVELDLAACRAALRGVLPAALVPLLAPVEQLPTRGSGKVDRDALPWPLARADDDVPPAAGLSETAQWVAQRWTAALGVAVAGPKDDFFDAGGGSLVAAQLVSALRERFPTVTVADVYENPRIGDLARTLDELEPVDVADRRVVRPTPLRAQVIQTAARGAARRCWSGCAGSPGCWPPTCVLRATTEVRVGAGRPGRRVVGRARLAGADQPVRPDGDHRRSWRAWLLRDLRPGWYARGGSRPPADLVHRVLGRGGRVGEPVVRAVDGRVRACPRSERRQRRRPAHPAAGHRDADARQRLLGRARGRPARVLARRRHPEGRTHPHRQAGHASARGPRSVPGARIGQGAEIAPGSAVLGPVPPGELWTGSPAVFDRPGARAVARRAGASRTCLGGRLRAHRGAARGPARRRGRVRAPGRRLVRARLDELGEAAGAALRAVPLGALAMVVVLLVVTLVSVRLLGIGLAGGLPRRAQPARVAGLGHANG